MRQVTSLHRTLVVLAVGLLALAAPLVAYADGPGPIRRLAAQHMLDARGPSLRASRRYAGDDGIGQIASVRDADHDDVALPLEQMRSPRSIAPVPRRSDGSCERLGTSPRSARTRSRFSRQCRRRAARPPRQSSRASSSLAASLRELRLDGQPRISCALMIVARAVARDYGRPVVGLVETLLACRAPRRASPALAAKCERSRLRSRYVALLTERRLGRMRDRRRGARRRRARVPQKTIAVARAPWSVSSSPPRR